MLNVIQTHDPEEQVELASQQYFLAKSALEINPLSFSARASLAASALKLGQLGDKDKGEEAIGLYIDLTERLPGYEPIYTDLTTAHLIMGQTQEAVAVVEQYDAFTRGPSFRPGS